MIHMDWNKQVVQDSASFNFVSSLASLLTALFLQNYSILLLSMDAQLSIYAQTMVLLFFLKIKKRKLRPNGVVYISMINFKKSHVLDQCARNLGLFSGQAMQIDQAASL